MTSLENKIMAFIGAGVMAEAMIQGLLNKRLLPPQNIIAADPFETRGQQLYERYGLQFTTDNATAVQRADIVVLSTKPQVMPLVLTDIHQQMAENTLILSVAAGIKLQMIIAGTGRSHVVRAIPNTPAQIGQGMTVWVPAPDISAEEQTLTKQILGAMGEDLQVNDEKYIDMATAINGSGPAYIFLIMEAMIDAGVHMGFSRQDAQKLVQQTLLGSVAYAIDSGKHPAELRNQVTSPGGTTAAALSEMERGGLRTVLADGIWAAYNRSRTLGGDK